MIGTHRTTTSNIPIDNERSRLIVTFHNTAVVQVVNDRYVILNSGGWLTPTTKRRMNQASDVYRLNRVGCGMYKHLRVLQSLRTI